MFIVGDHGRVCVGSCAVNVSGQVRGARETDGEAASLGFQRL